ncbi:MAG: alpha amylase C-terminal domain-containing protein, partial [Lachnospiraceae bacterium]|nr:alpha amylase C-terminal domain-containing protein [Lachnospiraceae bacterium]
VSGFPELTGEVTESCLGFDFKWNHEWRKDFLNYMGIPAYMRESHYNDLSLSMIYQYSDSFVVGYPAPEFIGGSSAMISRMAGETEKRKFDNMKLAFAYAFVHPGKKIVFMGQDMAQYPEWKEEEALDMELLGIDKHKNVNDLLTVLNKIYKEEPALYELDNDTDGFEWINNISARESVLTFVRKGTKEDELLLIACNFDAVDREEYKIGVPKRGKYKEIFNSDSTQFGGNGFTNPRLKQSKTDECDGREESVRVNLAALSVSIFKYSKIEEKVVDNKTAKANVKKAAAKKTETVKKTQTAKKAKKTETIKKAKPVKETAASKKSEPEKKDETIKSAEATKKTETEKEAKTAKAAQAGKKAESVKKDETDKKAEPAKKDESSKKTETAEKTEGTTDAKIDKKA